MPSPIRPYDISKLREEFANAEPFPFLAIDDFLEEDFVRELVDAYPDFDEARGMGREFSALNEKLKVQITESEKFPAPVARLNEAISSPAFLSDLAEITGIPNLIADPELRGGGMHVTNSTGRLDVHVDFNYIEEEDLHRRLNILIYLNPDWQDDWGGQVELWDKDVKSCRHSFVPILNRCVIFATSNISFHGVTPVTCPPGKARQSFAAYYYTREAPDYWTGKAHTTIFKARPDEKLRGSVLMPAQKLGHAVLEGGRSIRRKLRKTLRPEPRDGSNEGEGRP